MEICATSLIKASTSFSISVVLRCLSVFLFVFFSIRWSGLLLRKRKISNHHLPAVPSVAGALPLLVNLLQMKRSKPFLTFTRWAQIYGPIYSIRIGPSRVIVLNSTEHAKEGMVTRFDSIVYKDMSIALNLITDNKGVISTSDYNDFYRMAKRHLVSYLSGTKALKQSQHLRESMVEDIINHLTSRVKINPTKEINIREIFDSELFRSVLKEGVGCDLESLYVQELGETMLRNDIYNAVVLDIVKSATAIDIRDRFPYLSRIPIPFASRVEKRVKQIVFRRMAVMNALIREHKRLCNIGQGKNCYYDYLKSQPDTAELSETQTLELVSEIIGGNATPIVVEWTLSKDAQRQDILHQEIEKVCGSRTMCEDDLSRIPYLSAIVQETLRAHHPTPILPSRLVKEDTQIGGYHVPAGNKGQWKDADEWIPERFLGNKFDQQDRFKTLSFGAGKRVCPGATLATLTLCLTIGRLVKKCMLSLNEEDEGDMDSVGLTTHKLHPLHLVLKPRY